LIAKASRAQNRARIDPHGHDAGKKIKGKKRHILLRHVGFVAPRAIIHPADIPDRGHPASVDLVRDVSMKKLFADGGHQGQSSRRL
jgi:hypothetical protein